MKFCCANKFFDRLIAAKFSCNNESTGLFQNWQWWEGGCEYFGGGSKQATTQARVQAGHNCPGQQQFSLAPAC